MEFSEELARNITDSFKAIADATQRITETASMLTCMMTKLVIQSEIAKCSKYSDKYINGGPILRRYWKRKLEKEFAVFVKLLDKLENMEEK